MQYDINITFNILIFQGKQYVNAKGHINWKNKFFLI